MNKYSRYGLSPCVNDEYEMQSLDGYKKLREEIRRETADTKILLHKSRQKFVPKVKIMLFPTGGIMQLNRR